MKSNPIVSRADKKPMSELFRYALARLYISITLVALTLIVVTANAEITAATKFLQLSKQRQRNSSAIRNRHNGLCLFNLSHWQHTIMAYFRQRRSAQVEAERLGAIKLMKRGDGTILLVLFVSCGL